MKRIALLVLLAAPVAAQNIQFLSPTRPFNVQETQKCLEPGQCTLMGVVRKKAENPTNTYLGIVVTLFPYTDYFQEYKQLQKEHQGGDQVVAMSPEAFSYRVLAKASDRDGTFVIPNLKPGKYYLETFLLTGTMATQERETGRTTITNVWGQVLSETPHYEKFSFKHDEGSSEQVIVEIPAQSEVFRVTL